MKKFFVASIMMAFLLFTHGAADGRTWYQTGGLEGVQVIYLTIDPSDPSILYASTFGNSVFKSVDGGVNWIQLGAGLPGGSYTYMVSMDPVTSSTLYVSTVGYGIFKSTDSGNSWQAANTGLTNLRVHMEPVMDPQNPSILYVGTEGPVFKSINGGDTWIESNNGLGDHTEVGALAIDPSDSLTIYAGSYFEAGWNSGGVFKSINGGQNWSPVNTGLPDIDSPDSSVTWIAIDPTNTQIVYVSAAAGVFKTINGGQNWNPVNTGLTTLSIGGLSIHPSNPDILYAGSFGGGIFRTGNGGTNWYPLNDGLADLDTIGVTLEPSNPSILFTASMGGGGVYKSIAGDFSGDGTVDGSDLRAFSGFYAAGQLPEADLPEDGIMNPDDVKAFARNFGIAPHPMESILPITGYWDLYVPVIGDTKLDAYHFFQNYPDLAGIGLLGSPFTGNITGRNFFLSYPDGNSFSGGIINKDMISGVFNAGGIDYIGSLKRSSFHFTNLYPGETLNAPNPLFAWAESAGADKFFIRVMKDNAQGTCGDDQSCQTIWEMADITDRQVLFNSDGHALEPLPPGNNYRVRVYSQTADQTGLPDQGNLSSYIDTTMDVFFRVID